MKKVFGALFGLGLILFINIIFLAQAKAEIGKPEIINLASQGYLALSGKAPVNTEILIYIDGKIAGQIETNSPSQEESCSKAGQPATSCQADWQWRYSAPPELTQGEHFFIAVSQDKTSLVLSAPTQEIKFVYSSLPAPTLLDAGKEIITSNNRPLILGLTKNETLVKIFINDNFVGQTQILKHESETANFSYQSADGLVLGKYFVWAVAEDLFGRVSPKSLVLNLVIEPPFPAPIIFQPVVNWITAGNRPFIVGLAKNDSRVKVYIDRKYNGEFRVNNHSSGTANFSYQPASALTRGSHSVYAIAINGRGKESLHM